MSPLDLASLGSQPGFAASLFEAAEPGFSWLPRWTGATVVVVASGPSAKDVPLHLAQEFGARFVTVNTSWKLAPWADITYACDYQWWLKCRGLPQFKGFRVSPDKHACSVFQELKRVHAQRGVEHLTFDQLGYLCWSGNSGTQALNLAAQLEPAKIILVGFDMTVEYGLHWHASHPGGLTNPKPTNIERWRRRTDEAAGVLARRGIKVINCSPISTLQNYPKMSLQEALACAL